MLKWFGFINGQILKSFDKRKQKRPSILVTELGVGVWGLVSFTVYGKCKISILSKIWEVKFHSASVLKSIIKSPGLGSLQNIYMLVQSFKKMSSREVYNLCFYNLEKGRQKEESTAFCIYEKWYWKWYWRAY